MSMEAMKQALEVLEDFVDDPRAQKEIDEASTALRQALAEAEKQEPVAYLYHDARTPMDAHPWLHSTMLVLAADRRQGLQGETPLYTHPQPKQPLMLEKFREMKALLDDDIHTHKKMFTDDELKIIMETTMPEIDWKARHGVELNNGERNKWMLEWFIAFARAIETAHGIKE